MDIARIIRLRDAVRAVADSEVIFGPEVFLGTYRRLRAEVAEAVGGLADELDRLFPEQIEMPDAERIETAHVAQRRLAGIAGWLDGVIEAEVLHHRIRAEAEAAAKDRGKRLGL